MTLKKKNLAQRWLTPELLIQFLLVSSFVILTTLSCLEYYQEPTYSQVQLEPADMPAFTICPALIGNQSVMKFPRTSFQENLLLKVKSVESPNATVEDIYSKYALDFRKMSRRIGKRWNSSSKSNFIQNYKGKGEWWRTYLKAGICYTYKPIGRQDGLQRFLGPHFRFRAFPEFTQRTTNFSFALWIHGNNGPLVEQQLSVDEEFIPKVNLLEGSSTSIEISINRYRTVSLRRAPCNSTRGYSRSLCLSSCIHDRHIKILGCATLYMNRNDVRLCDRAESPFTSLSTKKNVPHCKCLPACQQDIITTSVGAGFLTAKPGYVRISFLFHYRVDARLTLLKLQPSDLLVNVGGFIGLLLGWSLLSMGVAVLEVLRRFCTGCTARTVVANDNVPTGVHTNLKCPCREESKQPDGREAWGKQNK